MRSNRIGGDSDGLKFEMSANFSNMYHSAISRVWNSQHNWLVEALYLYSTCVSRSLVLTDKFAFYSVTGEAGIIHQVEVPKVGVGDFWDAFSIDMRHLMIFDRNNLLPSEPSFDILRPDILEPSLDIDNNTGQDKGRFISSLSLGSRAVEINKEEVLKSPKSTSSMVRSVALLHDYHNYNGIRWIVITISVAKSTTII